MTHRSARLPLLLAVVFALAACGGASSAAPTPSPVAATPVPATPAPTPPPTPAPPASPSPTPAATPVAFVSAAYGYAASFPAGTKPRQATKPWDGEARIDSTGPYTDQVTLPGSILFFVYGAPTDLDLAAYAERTQAQMVAWHDCPAVPAATSDLALDGTPGRVHEMSCLGLFVQKLMVVRDGEGLVVNLLAPPSDPDAARALLRELVASMTWPA
jgi:hypothetical protein